jgi:membrane fusion protein (multidrug efflux system)
MLLISLLAPGGVQADDAPSVLVQTEMPYQGTLPDILTVYGTAMPALNGRMTLSMQQNGRVTAIAVTPGEKVQAGQHLLEFTVSAAESSTFKQAVNALSLAQAERAHTVQLLRQQLATRDQLAQAEKAVSDAQAALDALRREGAGEPVRNLDAPFDGIVETIPVAQGVRTQAGVPLLTLTRLDGLVVTVGIEPGEQARVSPGQPVRLTPLMGGGESINGHLLRVDAVLNPKTRMVDADIAVPGGKVMPGAAFRADIDIGQIRGWVVPHDAVLADGKGTYVFQVTGGKATRVDVALVGSRGGQEAITGALDPARALVTQGNYQLDDGMAVREGPKTSQDQSQGVHG